MAKATRNQEVNFEVKSIAAGEKEQTVKVYVVFKNGSDCTFTRKYFTANGFNVVIISGCKVEFDSELKVSKVSRLYDTMGKKKLDSSIAKHIVDMAKEIPDETKETETDDAEIHCKEYKDIMTCLQNNIPVYLAGPAGCGKNFTVEDIAKQLGWNFYFSNSVQDAFKLTGFVDAGGKYHETEFYEACTCKSDCIFFLDEIDASIPEVLVLLNAAIANGYFSFPNGRVSFDKVHFVAAGNTVGNGADESYTGRMVIDQATLDRFAIINLDYDERVEMHITHGNKALVEFVHGLRKQAIEKGIRTTFSYRCLMMVTKLETAGMSIEKILMITVFKGLDKDTLNTFISDSTKYGDALRKIRNAA